MYPFLLRGPNPVWSTCLLAVGGLCVVYDDARLTIGHHHCPSDLAALWVHCVRCVCPNRDLRVFQANEIYH